MGRRARLIVAACAGACAFVLAGAAHAAEPAEVAFPSQDGTALKAWLYMPQQAPRGTVVALHGCGGLYATRGAREGLLNARHHAMGEMLAAQGYAAVFPDSLTPRGEKEICTQKFGARKIDQRQRRADALGAFTWVAAQPWADTKRIAVLGWSHGGSAVLAATDATRDDVMSNVVKPAIAIAFYPGCSDSLKSRWKPDTRLVIMIGELDDWTPAAPCVSLGKDRNVEVTVFPDSYHDFDNPIGTVVMRKDVPNGVNPGQGVHAGANPVAREQANARVRDLLGAAFR